MVGDPIFPTNSAQYGNSTNPNAPRAMGTPVTIELAAHKQDWLGRSSRRTSQRARAGHVRLILLRLPGTRQLLCGDGLGDGPDLSQLHFLTQPTTGLSPPHTHTVAQKTSNQVQAACCDAASDTLLEQTRVRHDLGFNVTTSVRCQSHINRVVFWL